MAHVNPSKLDDVKIQDKFEEAFRALADDRDNELKISDFDVNVIRDPNRDVKVQVVVYGLAEVTTQDQFYNPATKAVVKGGKKVEFDVDGRGTVSFVLEKVERKNSNDYVVQYQPA